MHPQPTLIRNQENSVSRRRNKVREAGCGIAGEIQEKLLKESKLFFTENT